MGLLNGPLTFSRFMVVGRPPSDFSEFIDQRIKRHAFHGIGTDAQEKIMGWVGIENLLDTDFRHASYAWGDYLLFSLRIDRRSVPPSLLKIRALEAEQQHLKETGRKKIDKATREQIRDSVRQGLLGRTLPTPSFYEICWSVSNGSLLFTNLSEKVMQDFQDLFKASFDLTPLPYVPWDPQVMDKETAGNVEALQTADAGAVDPKTLGREFLTWLWFKSEERNGTILIPGVGETEINLVRRLVLESGDGDYSESVVCQGMHADLKEGRDALRRGKKIKEARLKLSRDAATWEFTLKADRFQFQSLKMPVVMDMKEEQENRDGRVLERIYLLETVIRSMDRLFAMFVSLRLPENWQHERTRMEKWLQSSSGQ
ncbi:MAG: hypothetical protein C0394_03710 [Syntrophus sp. (in: bacteria)]|nr:hypothetical protein [Syntrophus sp. (in: bacteria)]